VSRSKLIACLVATWLVWGTTYLAIKLALPAFPPFLQMGTRFVVAGTIMLLWAKLRRVPSPTPLQWRNAAIISALLLVGGAGATAYTEKTVASGLVAAFIALEPALIAVGNFVFGQKASRREVTGILIGLAGVALLMRGAGFSASPAGLIAISIGTVCWSVGSVLAVHVFKPAAGMAGAASQMLCGGLSLLLLAFCAHEAAPWPIPAQALLAWLYLVVFGSVVAFSAYTVLLAEARTSIAMSYTFVNPVVALVLGSAAGEEHFTTAEWLATAIIVASVVLILMGAPRQSTQPVSPARAHSSSG
jgi:drug/metabolite transporter (DMT)-like permease